MDKFKFPKRIVFLGRFLTATKVVVKSGVRLCLYEDDEIGVQTSFSEIEFKYNEFYGLIERRKV